MCGIYGEFSLGGVINVASAHTRLNRLAHRGPDGWGVAVGNLRAGTMALSHNSLKKAPEKTDFMLGHRRLSIIDLSDAALQPMAVGDYVIVFNGEIYNFAEIKPKLVQLGHDFTTDHSDTEILLHAFIEWGERCLSRLRGMFAFAVLCRRERRLFLARDRIGQKPLYYELAPTGFAFASQLTALPGKQHTVDPVSLSRYLLFGYVPDPGTIFNGPKKLPPAHYAWVNLDRGSIELYRYWDLPASVDPHMNVRECEANIREALANAVDSQLVSDVPYGLFLSGGIDSTLVTKMAAERSGRRQQAYFANIQPRGTNEWPWIARAAEYYRIDVYPTPVNLATANRFEEIIDVADEPFDGGSAVASYELYRGVVGRAKMVLTGDGGDELFGGYNRYRSFQKRTIPVSKVRGGKCGARFMDRLSGLNFRSLRGIRDLLGGHYLADYLCQRARLSLLDLLQDPVRDWHDLLGFVEPVLATYDGADLRAVRALDLKTILPGRMLFKVDRFSMVFGIEARSPFMDHELVELAFRTPDHFLVDRSEGKKPLKSILSKDLGQEFLRQPKTGFGNPLKLWFTDPSARNRLLNVLNDTSAAIWRFLRRDRVLARFSIVDGQGDVQDVTALWRLVVLARYLERHANSLA
ncbi:MAG: asparagine synthase (glutamine-hydrolyzing) [Gammaproteobacteria bacterium]